MLANRTRGRFSGSSALWRVLPRHSQWAQGGSRGHKIPGPWDVHGACLVRRMPEDCFVKDGDHLGAYSMIGERIPHQFTCTRSDSGPFPGIG